MAGSNLDHLRIQAQPSTPSPRSLAPTLTSIYLCLRIIILLILCLSEFVHNHKISIALYSPGFGRNTVLFQLAGHVKHNQSQSYDNPIFNLSFSIMQFKLPYPQICECYFTKSNKRQWIIVCSHIYSSSWRSPFWQSVCVTCCGSINSIFITSR